MKKCTVGVFAILLAGGLAFWGIRDLANPSQLIPAHAEQAASANKSARQADSANEGSPAGISASLMQPTKLQNASAAGQPAVSRSGPATYQTTKNSPPPNISWSRTPSPLDSISPEEAKWFPRATVVAATVVPGPGGDQKTQVRILQTAPGSCVPSVRTEEVINTSTSRVVLREEMAANQVLVSLPEGMSPGDLIAKFPDQLVSFHQVTPNAPLYNFQLASSGLTALPDAIESISSVSSAKPDTTFVTEPNFLLKISQILTQQVPDDEFFPLQWGMYAIEALDAWYSNAYGYIPRTAAGTPPDNLLTVAVVDTGIDDTHVDLAGNMWDKGLPPGGIYGINASELADPPSNPPLQPTGPNITNTTDRNGHGTHVAGTIGAFGNNTIGVSGVAMRVKLMACKAFDDSGVGTNSAAIACIDYAWKNHAKIINASWGGYSYSSFLREAISRAGQAQVLFVAAAGNFLAPTDLYSTDDDLLSPGMDIGTYPSVCYPASYASPDGCPTPQGGLDNIVGVLATLPTTGDTRAPYSNFSNKCITLGAPGDHIFSTDCISSKTYGKYSYKSGTSMAAAHVSGALALLWAQYPNDSYTSIVSRLQSGSNIGVLPSNEAKQGATLNLYKSLSGLSPRPTPTPRPVPIPRSTPPRTSSTRTTSSRSSPAVGATPTPAPTVTPTATATPTATPTPRATATPRPTATPRF
jgi:subtilisin family serine protease